MNCISRVIQFHHLSLSTPSTSLHLLHPLVILFRLSSCLLSVCSAGLIFPNYSIDRSRKSSWPNTKGWKEMRQQLCNILNSGTEWEEWLIEGGRELSENELTVNLLFSSQLSNHFVLSNFGIYPFTSSPLSSCGLFVSPCDTDGIRLPENHRQVVHPTNGTLVIREISRDSDEGQYTCTAANRLGMTSKSGLHIIVQGEYSEHPKSAEIRETRQCTQDNYF